MFQKPVAESESESESMSFYSAPQQDDVETIVGPSVHVEGDFASEGNILVKGSVSGNVKTSKLLTVEHGARILANVRSGDAHVSGEIKGNVRVQERLELTASAQILGDIICTVLVVEPGALIQGKINMQGISLDETQKTTTKRVARRRKSSETAEGGEAV